LIEIAVILKYLNYSVQCKLKYVQHFGEIVYKGFFFEIRNLE